MNKEKEIFLRKKFVPLLQQLNDTAPARWGKMNVQQMIEHFTDALMAANGKIRLPVITLADKLPRFYEFLLSEKQFKENTKSPVLGDDPSPIRKNTKQAAIGKLQEELIYFFETFRNNPGLKTINPAFGELNYEENIQLLYKHAVHHLRQFGVEVI